MDLMCACVYPRAKGREFDCCGNVEVIVCVEAISVGAGNVNDELDCGGGDDDAGMCNGCKNGEDWLLPWSDLVAYAWECGRCVRRGFLCVRIGRDWEGMDAEVVVLEAN